MEDIYLIKWVLKDAELYFCNFNIHVPTWVINPAEAAWMPADKANQIFLCLKILEGELTLEMERVE